MLECKVMKQSAVAPCTEIRLLCLLVTTTDKCGSGLGGSTPTVHAWPPSPMVVDQLKGRHF